MILNGQVVNAGENGEGGYFVEIDTIGRRGSFVFDVDDDEKDEFPEGRKVRVTIEGLGTGDWENKPPALPGDE